MATFGISIISPAGSIVESADIEAKSDFKQLINSVGEHAQAKSYDVNFAFSARGKGDTCPFDVGASAGVPSGADGKAFWTSVKLNSKNDDFRGWEASGVSYKHA